MADAEALLEPLIPALRRYAYALVRDHDAADDLVQDTLERALSRWTLRRRDGDLRAWLFTIQRNLHVSALRQGQRRGAHVELDEATTPSSAAQQESGLEVQDILATLDQLPEEQKSLLLLVGAAWKGVPAAGGATAQPATPVGYLSIRIAGNTYKIPYHNP